MPQTNPGVGVPREQACAVLVSYIADPSWFFGLLLLIFCWKSSEFPVEVTYVVIVLLVVFLWKYQ